MNSHKLIHPQIGRLPRFARRSALVLLPLVLIAATGPQWWVDRGARDPYATANDYAAINQGQAKNLLRASVDELDANLPGGAGDTLHAMVASWASPTAQTNDYNAVNGGQLKALMMPILNRLIEEGYATAYPWASATNANDYAVVNIGQAKALFAFNLLTIDADADHDGIPDAWQQSWGEQLGLTVTASGIDPACGLTYLQEYLSGHIPGTPVVTEPAEAVALEVYTPLR